MMKYFERLQTRGERFFSASIGDAQGEPQILDVPTIQDLSAARKNVRSVLLSHEFDLPPSGDSVEWLYIVPDGRYLSVVGILSDCDAVLGVHSPKIQINYPDSRHAPLVWSQPGDLSIVSSSALSSQEHGKILEEPFDYLKIVNPTQVIEVHARRDANDNVGARRFNLVLVCVEMSRNW